jgi:hypothetical protein
MPTSSVEAERQRQGKAGPLAWLLARGLEGPMKLAAWDLVRALALVGFVLFALASSVAWLRLNITKPLKNEEIHARDIYSVSPIEQDIDLLRRWLPMEGKVGYLSEKPDLQRYETRLRLAPLLLDYDWGKHDWVLVDYPVRQGQAIIESPSYQLVADLTDAKSFARGMRIYRRRH